MTIEIGKTIAFMKKVAEKNRRAMDFESRDKIDEDTKINCLHCAEAHEQLAEWLEELEMYRSLAPRELVSEKQRHDRDAEYHKGFNDGYSTGVDDFAKQLHYEEFDNAYGVNIVLTPKQVDRFAEQLKAGETHG